MEQGPELADALAAGADAGQGERLVTVYARAAGHGVFAGRLDAQLTGLCLRHRDSLMPAAVQVATRVEAPGPLLAALSAYAQDPAVRVEELMRLADSLPDVSYALAECAAQLTDRIVRELRTAAHTDLDAYLPDLAMSLNNLSNRLGELGQREEGLEAIREAVQIRRTLAQAHPDTYLEGAGYVIHAGRDASTR